MRLVSTFDACGEPESTSACTFASVLNRKCGSTCACNSRRRASDSRRSYSLRSSSNANACSRTIASRCRRIVAMAIHGANSNPAPTRPPRPERPAGIHGGHEGGGDGHRQHDADEPEHGARQPFRQPPRPMLEHTEHEQDDAAHEHGAQHVDGYGGLVVQARNDAEARRHRQREAQSRPRKDAREAGGGGRAVEAMARTIEQGGAHGARRRAGSAGFRRRSSAPGVTRCACRSPVACGPRAKPWIHSCSRRWAAGVQM